MDYGAFITIIGAKKPPELPEFERATVFAHAAGKEVLWTALATPGIHGVYLSLITQVLQKRIIEEELARRRDHQRKLEEEARGVAEERPAPRRRAR